MPAAIATSCNHLWDLGDVMFISKRACVLFTYYAYLILFVRIPCHLDAQIYVSFGPRL